MLIEINYWAVLVAGIASMVIGGLWYSPLLFGRVWAKLMGLPAGAPSPEVKKTMIRGYSINFIAALVMAYVVARLISLTMVATVSAALGLGFWLWLGLVATVMIGTILWEGKSTKLYVINAGYQLVNILVISAILAAWR